MIVPIVGLAAVLIAAWWRSGGPAFAASRLYASLRAGLIYGVPAFIAALPWLAKSTVFTRNPVYPLLDGIFHSPFWSQHADQTMVGGLRNVYGVGHDPIAVLGSLWNLTFLNIHFAGVIGPIFLSFIPLVPLFVWINRTALPGGALPLLGLWAGGLALFIFWALTVSEARFAFPALAIMLGAGVVAFSATRDRLALALSSVFTAAMLLQALLNLPGFKPWHTETAYPGDVIVWRDAELQVSFGRESEGTYFASDPGFDYWRSPPVIAYINAAAKATDKRIFVYGPPMLPYYYLDPHVMLYADFDVVIHPLGPINIKHSDALAQLQRNRIDYMYLDDVTYHHALGNESLAGHMTVVVTTPSPPADYLRTPMRLIKVTY